MKLLLMVSFGSQMPHTQTRSLHVEAMLAKLEALFWRYSSRSFAAWALWLCSL